MHDQLKRILRLVRKTGDTMIVTDPNGEDVYVVMGLDQYETLRRADDFDGLIDEAMSDEAWEEFQGDRHDESKIASEKKPDIWSAMKPAGEEGETWDVSKLSDPELKNLEDQYKLFAAEAVSETVQDQPQTPQKSNKNQEDFGEEQFYLEPIE